MIQSIMKTRPKGIEPLSQEPESYVISTTLRAQIVSILSKYKKIARINGYWKGDFYEI